MKFWGESNTRLFFSHTELIYFLESTKDLTDEQMLACQILKETGCTAEELIQLCPIRVDSDKSQIKFETIPLKDGVPKYRSVPVSYEMMEKVDRVFGIRGREKDASPFWSVGPRDVDALLKRTCNRIGVESTLLNTDWFRKNYLIENIGLPYHVLSERLGITSERASELKGNYLDGLVLETIDRAIVLREYDSALVECNNLVPIDRWSVKPTKQGFTTHKTKYGLATSDGEVLISEAFLGTTAINKLRNVIRHELAHLAIGLNQHHNKLFRRVERQFGATKPISEDEESQIISNIFYKWELVAHMVDGTTRDVGSVHKKTKRYSEYSYKNLTGLAMRIGGITVDHFEFIENVRS